MGSVISDAILIVGGVSNGEVSRVVDIKRRPGVTLQRMNNLHRNFYNGAGAAGNNGSVLICGGRLSTIPDQRCEIINSRTLAVTKAAPLPLPSTGHRVGNCHMPIVNLAADRALIRVAMHSASGLDHPPTNM